MTFYAISIHQNLNSGYFKINNFILRRPILANTKTIYLTKREYSQKYNISEITVTRLINKGELPIKDLTPSGSKKRLLRIIETVEA